MVTIIAGRPNNKKKCKLISLNENIGSLRQVEFDISVKENIKTGEPKWANYIKGCIAYFPCKFTSLIKIGDINKVICDANFICVLYIYL